MGRTTVWVTAGVVALALIGGSLAAALTFSGGAPQAVVVIDKPLPTFSLPNVIPDRPPVTSAWLGRQSAVVLNIWGSWCPPCRAEMPGIEAAHRRLGPRVTFVGLDVGDVQASATSFLKRLKITYPSGFDPNYTVANAIGDEGTPMTYFIAHGKELSFDLGAVTEKSLLSQVKLYFGTPGSPPRLTPA